MIDTGVIDMDVAREAESAYAFRLRLLPAVSMTQDQFFEFCQQNRKVRMERTAQGELIIIPPAGGESSAQNVAVASQLFYWANFTSKIGKVFDSSAGFILPNGANRSPDAAWVSDEQMAGISTEQFKKFLPVCPDFVVEVLSPSDVLRLALEKMEEYMANGARLGWLINPRNKTVRVYRPGQEVQVLDNPATLAGDPELPGFVLDLRLVWQA
jgi:Uma2 family endonuclease